MANSFFDWVGALSGNRFVARDTARADDVNTALDYVSTGFTAVEVKTDAAIRLPDGETATTLGNAVARAGKVLGFNAGTGAVEAVITGTDIADAAANASAAAASAASAIAAYDLFDDRFLGAKTSPGPTLDNDGNALVAGTLYFNTTVGEMRVWSGSAWIAAYLPSTSYATLDSPTFTGIPAAPTAAPGTNTTQLATTAHVKAADDLKANIASPTISNPTFTGTVTIPTPFTLGSVSVLPTGTELNYVDGVTSNIQTQLNTLTSSKAALSANTFTGDQTLDNNALKTIKTATFNSQASLGATSGNIAIDWSAAQNYRQPDATGPISYLNGGFTAPPGPCHLQLLIDSDGSSVAQTFTWPTTVKWYGSTFAHVANKKMIVNFWWDGTNYHGMWIKQV